MFENFEKFISAETKLTSEELKLLRSLAIEKKIRRRQFLLQEGEVCRYKAFVSKGLLRTYCIANDGTESIMRFAAENSWTSDAESFNNGIPSTFNIEALEDTEVLLWSRESLDQLFVEIPAFRLYVEKFIATTLAAAQKRVLINISYTAEEKYREFIACFPDIFARVPLHMVGSYLGLSRETLSRVRHAQREMGARREMVTVKTEK